MRYYLPSRKHVYYELTDKSDWMDENGDMINRVHINKDGVISFWPEHRLAAGGFMSFSRPVAKLPKGFTYTPIVKLSLVDYTRGVTLSEEEVTPDQLQTRINEILKK